MDVPRISACPRRSFTAVSAAHSLVGTKQPILLAIDLGTSGSRVIAFSSKVEIIAQSYYEFPSSYPNPGWVEQDPEVLWQATARALKDVLASISVADVASLGVTNQRETTILWERNS